MKQVAIYGAGGLGRLVLDILMQRRRCRPVAFLDSADAKHGSEVERLPVIGGPEKLATLRAAGVTGIIVAIGDNAERVRPRAGLGDSPAREHLALGEPW